jgi:hypothetical protein
MRWYAWGKMSRARFLPLIALSAIITACSTVIMLNSAGPASPNVPIEIVLAAILAVSGLMGDLIRGITIRADGGRNIGALLSVVAGILLGAVIGGLVFQFMAMLAD